MGCLYRRTRHYRGIVTASAQTCSAVHRARRSRIRQFRIIENNRCECGNTVHVLIGIQIRFVLTGRVRRDMLPSVFHASNAHYMKHDARGLSKWQDKRKSSRLKTLKRVHVRANTAQLFRLLMVSPLGKKTPGEPVVPCARKRVRARRHERKSVVASARRNAPIRCSIDSTPQAIKPRRLKRARLVPQSMRARWGRPSASRCACSARRRPGLLRRR